MEIKRIDSQPTSKGPAEWFTGSVRIQPMFESGASPTAAMTHIAIQEALEGKVVQWMEHVTDEEYRLGKQERRN